MLRTLKKVPSAERPGYVHEPGADAVLLEPLDPDKTVWLVELRVPDASLVGGAWFDCVELSLGDLGLRDDVEEDRKRTQQVVEGRTLTHDLADDQSRDHAPREKVAA